MLAEPEVHTGVTLGEIAPTARGLGDLDQVSGPRCHARADRAAVGRAAREGDDQEVAPVPTVVAQQGRWAIEVVDDEVEVAVVVEIAARRAAADARCHEGRASVRRDLHEGAVAVVPVEQRPLTVGGAGVPAVELRVDMAVDDEEIEPAVVVVVEDCVPQPTKGRLALAVCDRRTRR